MLNPNIALQVQRPRSPLENMAGLAQLSQVQQQNRLAELAMQDRELAMQDREVQRQRRNKLQELLSAGDTEDLPQRLTQGGFIDEASKISTDRRNNQKLDIESQEKRLKVAKERLNLSGSTMAWLRQNPTPENFTRAVNGLAEIGVFTPQQVQSYMAEFQKNPTADFVSSMADQGFRAALDAKDQLVKFETRNRGGTTDTLSMDPVSGKVRVVASMQNTQSPDAILSAETARRGQNMTDARARETNNLTREANANVYDPERGILVNRATGLARPAATMDGQPVGSKHKPMTDAQAKANLFGTRMKESDRILTDLEGKYSPMAVNAKMSAAEAPLVGGVAGPVANVMLSNEGQKAEQAQRDFINAVLRRESGAVISAPEFENAKKQYFPQPGDTKDVLAQKRRNRAIAISGMETEVPGGFRLTPSAQPGSVVDFGSLK